MRPLAKYLIFIASVGAVIAAAIIVPGQTRAVDERLPVPAQFANSEHRVREVAPDHGTKKDWEYEDSSGNSLKMSKCEDSGFLSTKTCFETEDRLVRFEYKHRRKGGYTQEAIIYDGVEHKVECIRNGSFWDWHVKFYCGSEPR